MIEILNRWTTAQIYKSETAQDIAEAVAEAWKARANLSRANLYGADLHGANLHGADLYGADLHGADLHGANLYGADLHGADLYGADLHGADLSRADLYGANLYGANLYGANLSRADLYGAKGANKYLTTPLYILFDQPGWIRAYKLVTADGVGPFNGGITYEVGKSYEVEADTDEGRACAAGINLASLDWCLKEWRTGYRILVAEFTREDIAAIPIGSDGKFRVRRCTIVAEKTLEEVGISIEPERKAEA